MKRTKKTRILALVLALMTMICMAVPAMAKTPTGKIIAPGVYNDVELYAGESKGSRVCPGGKSGHYDIITYTKNGKRHKVKYQHLRNHSGHWYIDESTDGAQFHSQY